MIPPLNKQGYVVRVSERALIQLCQSGLEAYCVPHSGRHRNDSIEVYGLLWGHESMLRDGRSLYAVDLVTTDTSPTMRSDAVYPKDESLDLKRSIMQSYWPQYGFLGDFHTHPYLSMQEVEEGRGYEFSDADIDSIEKYPSHWATHGLRVGLVLTIAAMQRAGSATDQWLQPNTVRFTLGNFRLWLKAYVASAAGDHIGLTSHNDENVLLDVPSILGLNGEYTDFGRVKSDGARMIFKAPKEN